MKTCHTCQNMYVNKKRKNSKIVCSKGFIEISNDCYVIFNPLVMTCQYWEKRETVLYEKNRKQ